MSKDIAAIGVITKSQQSSKGEKRKYSVGVTLLIVKKVTPTLFCEVEKVLVVFHFDVFLFFTMFRT